MQFGHSGLNYPRATVTNFTLSSNSQTHLPQFTFFLITALYFTSFFKVTPLLCSSTRYKLPTFLNCAVWCRSPAYTSCVITADLLSFSPQTQTRSTGSELRFEFWWVYLHFLHVKTFNLSGSFDRFYRKRTVCHQVFCTVSNKLTKSKFD